MSKPKIVAIIQARLGSSRLPLKSLLCLRDLPIIDWVTSRVSQSKALDDLIVAVPDTPLDLALQEHLRKRGIPCMAGPENDVLKRFGLASQQTQADIIVRVCADNPLIWGEAIDELIDFYLSTGCDYAWNHIPRDNMWPDGLGAEIISAELLVYLEATAGLPAQREHCFNYIWDNRADFAMQTFDPTLPALRRPDIRLDIDSPQDYARLAGMKINPAMSGLEIIEAWDALKNP